MSEETSALYQIALSIVPKIGSRRARQLIQHFGSAEAVFKAKSSELQKVSGIAESIAKKFDDASILKKAEKELEFISKNRIKMLYYMEDEYPGRLKHYEDAPICLYYRGSTPLNGRKHVSIIGTRTPTDRGRWICEKLVQDLKDYDINIISGLAYGIDIAAHKTSLKVGLPTIGVVAHGLDTIYPAAHKPAAREMIGNGGILTEFTSKTIPDRERFPARNRIIAGLSDALIVIESKESGGSMITANFANDYSKDVFAIPGRIDDESSQGCNLLIKQHKAFLLDSAEELLKMMRWDVKSPAEVQRSLFSNLNRDEQKVVECIKMGVDDVDGMSNALSMSPSEMASLLLELEMDGVIKSVPGKKYIFLG